jgi:photosystem II stability/assembly factor-like uncharacterized protein
MASCVQNNPFNPGFRWFLQPFTHLLQLFTTKRFPDCEHLISLLHRFTQSIKVMNIIYSLAGLLLFQFLSCKQASESPNAFQLQNQKRDKNGTANIAFKSTDNGQTWQNISKGLPENLPEDSIRGNNIFANDKGLFIKVGNEFYQSTPNATAPFWTKEIFRDKDSSIASGTLAYHYWGINLKKPNGTSIWSPIFENVRGPRLRSAFETAGGTIFMGTDRGIFKTDNSGKTWKQVHTGELAGNLAESNGVLLATCMRRIIRSTDNGENWAVVSSEGGLAFDVKQIKGGFAAITSGSESGTRTIRTSYDGGNTWQPIDDGRRSKTVIDSIWLHGNDGLLSQARWASIIQVGENFFCTHPDGIFRSSDKGKTWKLLLPSIKGKFFNLCVSGNVIYVVSGKPGC